MGMGRYVRVTGVMGPGRYAVSHDIPKEISYVTVDKEYRGAVDPLNRDTPSEWCPFLMDADEEGRYICSIHGSAPSFCKNFKCCTCRIYDSSGDTTGTVKGRFTLATDDEKLKETWDKAVESSLDLDSGEQKKKIAEILEGCGYHAEFYG